MVLFIIAGILAIALLVPLVMYLYKPADIVFKLILIFTIFMTVRSFLGTGTLTLIISGILIWFMVFKYGYIFSSLYVLYTLLGIGFLSVIIWGFGTRMRQG